MEHEFVPHEQALALKELRFDEPCIAHFRGLDCEPTTQMGFGFKTEKNSEFGDGDYWIARPTFATAFKWFREKFGVYMYPTKFDETKWWINWGSWTSTIYSSFEEAELACLKKLIEIVKIIENERITN